MPPSIAQQILEISRSRVSREIYRYRPGRIVGVGSTTLAIVLACYGASYTDMAIQSSRQLWSASREEADSDLWMICKTFGAPTLGIIPFALSIAALMVPSRIVTSVKLVPGNTERLCEIITSRGRKTTLPLGLIRRTERPRAYTGRGQYGIDDTSSLAFYLKRKDIPKERWYRMFILPRTGIIPGSDGRLLDALFGIDEPILTVSTHNSDQKMMLRPGNSIPKPDVVRKIVMRKLK